MGETIIEKIIRHNTGKAVKPGDIVTVNVDRVMIHDIFIPFVAEKFEEMGFQKLWDPDKVVLIYDHLVPASQQDDTRHFHVGDAFAAKYGMKNVHRSDGICHQLMTEAIENMSVASRMTMANMAIEAGAKCALFTPDEKTAAYCNVELDDYQKSLVGDADAVYMKTITYKAEDFVPVMACPSQVDKIRDVSELQGETIDQVFIGSCTNGRLEDLMAAAEVLKGKKVADFVKLIVTPASRKIYRQAIELGILDTLAEAGAIITHPGCGLCCGRTGGILTDGEKVVATNNRNFLGRMGTSKVQIYLASPKTAAACAVAGKIVMPE